MKLSKEIKVGILGLAALAIFYFGFSFLKGLDLFSTVGEYHVKYKDVQGLEVSNPVTYNGVTIGRVMKMSPDYEKNMVDVTLAINKKVNVTDMTVANLADNGLIGGKIIKLLIKPGRAIESGGTINGNLEISMMQGVQDKLGPTLKNVDSLLLTLNKVVGQFDQTGQAMKVLMASATTTSNGVNGLVAGNSKHLGEITSNAAVLTQNLTTLTKSLDAQLKPILAKTGGFTDSLSRLQLGKTVNHLNYTISSMQSMLNDINKGQGTLGKFKTDDSLYLHLTHTASTVNQLLIDMKSNPKRYVHFSLFGRKN